MSSVHELKSFIDGGYWNNAIDLIKSDATICRTRYNVNFMTDKNEFSDVLPIHHACSKMDVPFELICTMLQIYPDSIQKVDSGMKRSCLHIAILKCLPDSIVTYLLEMFPGATKIQDRFGRVPLHYACSNLRSYDIIKKLIMPFPQCIQAPDWKQWTSLHVAVTKNTNPEIIQFMISLCPEVVLLRTNNHASALELMMDTENGMRIEYSVKVSKMILEKVDELNESPQLKNFMMDARKKPLTPVQMNPYGIV